MELITVAKEQYSGNFAEDIVGGSDRHFGRKGKLAII